MGLPVTWFEINGPDPEQNAKFYSELFGWHTKSMPEANYVLIDTHSGGGINGGFGQTKEGQPAHTVFYAEGPDIQALLDKAESLGAKTVVPRTDVPDMVIFAQFTDPFGNLVGLVEGDGSTNVAAGDNPPVNWFEISSLEPEKSWAFYRELFDWDIKESSGEGPIYGQVEEVQGVAGGIGRTLDQEVDLTISPVAKTQTGQPSAQVYAEVDDLQKYLDRAEALGASTIVQPMDVGEGTSIALFADPQGVTFGLYTHQH
jgi:predicted enzyme related to lactoylglutathione lyase